MRFTHKAMDTEFAVAFGAGEADEALLAAAAAAAFNRVDEIELTLSRFNDTSDVAVIRALKPGDVAPVAPETMAALVASAQVCGATRGAFDPTVGPVMDLLRRRGVAWQSLSEDERADAFARTGMNRLVLDVENLRVAVTPDRLGRDTPLELDFGGVGKGLALDECRKLFAGEQFEISSYLVDAGTSTIWAAGSAPDGKPWKLGVGGAWKGRTRIETAMPLADAALSGSGFEIQGAHIVDPRGRRAAARWAQTWATASSAAVADALSTAALSLAPDELEAACAELGARVLVARGQRPFLDRFRDPLRWFGAVDRAASV